MEVLTYNRASLEGIEISRLFDVKYNKSILDGEGNAKTVSKYPVAAVMHSRVNRVKFLFESNLAGFKRPLIHVEADVEMAWGDFDNQISALNFKHDKQELPLTYVQPIEDETMKVLIDAGLYREERFEQLMEKLMAGETFDAEGDMQLSYLDVADAAGENRAVPVVLVDPINIVHEKEDPSERTNLADLVRLAAKNAIELEAQGVKAESLVVSQQQVKEVMIETPITDVVSTHHENRVIEEVDQSLKAASALLNQNIDITDQVRSTLRLGSLSEDDRIRDLKERNRFANLEKQQEELSESVQNNIQLVQTSETDVPLDAKLFESGIGSNRRTSDSSEDRSHTDDEPSL